MLARNFRKLMKN
jgi:hypothetical protein